MDHRFLAHFDDDNTIELDDEWLSEQEQKEKLGRSAQRVRATNPQHLTPSSIDATLVQQHHPSLSQLPTVKDELLQAPAADPLPHERTPTATMPAAPAQPPLASDGQREQSLPPKF